MLNILMVEDDESLANIIKRYLYSFDINLTNTTSGKELLEQLEQNKNHYSLLILDLTLPDIDGLDLINQIKTISNIPIIISSARDDITDKIKGFDRGADDYLPKPYNPKELELRIKTILKRYPQKDIKNNDIFKIDDETHTIKFKNEKLDLTLVQYDILSLLIKRQPGIVSRDDIIYSSDNIDDYSGYKTIDVQISYIRKKLKQYDDQNYIKSVRGMGYKIEI
jgi:two-component system OmpR family response regulator